MSSGQDAVMLIWRGRPESSNWYPYKEVMGNQKGTETHRRGEKDVKVETDVGERKGREKVCQRSGETRSQEK